MRMCYILVSLAIFIDSSKKHLGKFKQVFGGFIHIKHIDTTRKSLLLHVFWNYCARLRVSNVGVLRKCDVFNLASELRFQ